MNDHDIVPFAISWLKKLMTLLLFLRITLILLIMILKSCWSTMGEHPDVHSDSFRLRLRSRRSSDGVAVVLRSLDFLLRIWFDCLPVSLFSGGDRSGN
jgi:hypothetical protein